MFSSTFKIRDLKPAYGKQNIQAHYRQNINMNESFNITFSPALFTENVLLRERWLRCEDSAFCRVDGTNWYSTGCWRGRPRKRVKCQHLAKIYSCLELGLEFVRLHRKNAISFEKCVCVSVLGNLFRRCKTLHTLCVLLQKAEIDGVCQKLSSSIL